MNFKCLDYDISYTFGDSLDVKLYNSKSECGTANRTRDNTRVGTLIVATIYLQLIQNRYMFRSFTVLQC